MACSEGITWWDTPYMYPPGVSQVQHVSPKHPGLPAFVVTSLFLPCRTPEPHCLHPEEAQDEQEAPNPVHHFPAAGSGAQVPPEAVSVHRWESRVLQLPQPYRDPSQNLVPESEGQGQETAGGWAREAQNGSEAHVAVRVQPPFPHQLSHPGRLTVWNILPFSQTCASYPARWTLCYSCWI